MITNPQLTLLRNLVAHAVATDMDVVLGWNVLAALVDEAEQNVFLREWLRDDLKISDADIDEAVREWKK